MWKKSTYPAAFAVLAVLIALPTGQLKAQSKVPGQYAVSKQPYWRVGTIDKKLSSACQRGEFRQRKYLVFSIGYNGGKGRGITGIATKEWNLLDKKGLAKTGMTYHFFNQGYSNCKVYSARSPVRKRQ